MEFSVENSAAEELSVIYSTAKQLASKHRPCPYANLHRLFLSSTRVVVQTKFRGRSKFRDYFNQIFAYASIIFINRTSTYTITFTHHREGHLGSGLGLV